MTRTPAQTAAPDTEGVELSPSVALRTIGRRFWPYARPYRRWIALSLLLVVVVPAIETLKIWMFKLVIDDVLVPKDLAPFVWIAAAFVVLTLVGGAVSVIDDMLSEWIGQRFVLNLRFDLFRHLHRVSLTSLTRRKPGDLLSRLTSDVNAIEGFVVGGLTNAVAFGAEAAFFTAALFYISWDLALVSLVVAPLFWFVAARFSHLIRDASRERRRRSGTISAVAEESLAGALMVQAYHRHDHEAERFRVQSEANFAASMRSTRLQAVFAPLVEGIEVLGALVVIGYGAWKLSAGHLSIGALLVFLTYLTQLYDPIRGLSKLVTSLHSAAAGAERVVEILDEPVAVAQAEHPLRPEATRGELRFDDVGFGYRDGIPAVADVSLTIAPGRITALVGPNGAGKSTLAHLALRLHDPDHGRITLDGVDLRDLDLEWLREQFAVVLQDPFLMDATVRQNIAFGRLDATDHEIAQAARRAGAEEFIAALPEGYDTRIGPRGAQLSGGQRQRLGIARAAVRDARVLIFDEPTNHLDAAAVAGVLDNLRASAPDRTTIVVTHDPAVIALADDVVTFAHGRVVSDQTPPAVDLIGAPT